MMRSGDGGGTHMTSMMLVKQVRRENLSLDLSEVGVDIDEAAEDASPGEGSRLMEPGALGSLGGASSSRISSKMLYKAERVMDMRLFNTRE